MINKIKIIENELVPVYETSTGEKVVYGSELHKVLEVKSRYREWINRRFSDIDAIENEDYEAAEISAPSGQAKKEYIIKLDTAKEMAMLERNEKGKQVRRYFIQIEKKYKANSHKMQTITYQYPVSPAAMDSATNAGRLFERIMRNEGVPPHEIAMVVRSLFQQAGVDVPEYAVKIPAYEQLSFDILTR